MTPNPAVRVLDVVGESAKERVCKAFSSPLQEYLGSSNANVLAVSLPTSWS
jgi:hypothetical protein